MKFALPLVLGIALAIVSGCSKQEKTETDHSQMKMAEAQTEPAPAPAMAMAAKPSVPAPTPAKLEPIPADMLALVASNKTASVYDQVYYITNSSFTAVQKAQTLMMILPSFQSRDDQRHIAHAATDYVTDETHSLVAAPLLEGKLNPQILSVLMTDTLKRSEAIKIPVLKSIAAKPEHPMQAEAEQLLVAFSKPGAFQQQASNKMD